MSYVRAYRRAAIAGLVVAGTVVSCGLTAPALAGRHVGPRRPQISTVSATRNGASRRLRAVRVAQLTEPVPGEGFFSIAEARGVAVGSLSPTTDYVDAGPAIPEVLVYLRGIGPWSTEGPAATLSDPAGLGALSVAISSDARVIAALLSGGDKLDVFVRPPGGWSGVVAPAAQLNSPNGRPMIGQVSFVGSGIVATTYGPPSKPSAGDTFVFPEPAGGWGGADLAPAILQHSNKPLRRGVAHHGPWVVVTRARGADVYAEPSAGWHGVVHQVGFLSPDKQFDGFPVYYSGRGAVIGHDVFSEPARGWTGFIRPTTRLTIKGLSTLGRAAIDGEVVATSSYQLGSEHKCPCSATIATAARPRHRQQDTTLTATPTVRLTTALAPPQPVLDGRTLFVGGAQTIPVYTLEPVAHR